MNWEEGARLLLRKLSNAGYEAYIVGGAVRDILMNREIRDIDISTDAPLERMKELFPRTIDVGIEHGTIVIPFEGKSYEVTQLRGKGTPTIIDDLALRDFTCNALAMDINGNVIDPFQGKKDIAEKTLRLVGSSPNRLKEDPIRLLRGLRFSIQLGFSIDNKTAESMSQYASLIGLTSVERITMEMAKLVTMPLEKKHIQFLLGHKVFSELPYIFPMAEVIRNNLTRLEESFSVKGPLEWWSFLAYTKNLEQSNRILSFYKLPTHLKRNILFIVKSVNEWTGTGWTDTQLYSLGPDRFQSAEKLVAVLEGRMPREKELFLRYDSLPIKSKKEIAITGKELLEWFPNKTGKWVGNCLQEIESVILSRGIPNDKRKIYDWVQKEFGG